MAQTITGTRNANMTMYRDEYIAGFERGGSLLRNCVTTEYMQKGNSVVFLVADSGNATAVTRGSDGLYPARSNNNNQVTLQLIDQTDLTRMNDFDIFSSQGPQREIMFKTSQDVIARSVDDQIITALDAGTLGANTTADTDALGNFYKGLTILGNNNAGVKAPGDVTALVSQGFYANLLKTKEFATKEYVDVAKLVNGIPTPIKMEQFMGVNIIVHTGLSGNGTSSEKCFMFHKGALGHAIDKNTFNPEMDFNREQNYSWVRCSAYMAAKLLQNTGVVQILHDASSYAPVTV